jgi:hypothetical protein
MNEIEIDAIEIDETENYETETDGPEVVVNLWYLVDEETGLIYRLAGRAYVLAGDDEWKLSVLKALSANDHLTAQSFKVPKRFSVPDGNGVLEGFCSAGVLDAFPFELYEEVLEHLQATMPTQASFEGNVPKAFRMEMPEDPLCVTTALIEDRDGVIRPMA